MLPNLHTQILSVNYETSFQLMNYNPLRNIIKVLQKYEEWIAVEGLVDWVRYS